MGQYELGQDIEKVQEIAEGFRRQATAMDRAHQEVLTAIATLRRHWGGSDFTSYDTRARRAAAQIADAARTVRAQATDLDAQIQEQVAASSVAGPGGGGAPPGTPTDPADPADPYDPDHPLEDEVHDEDIPIPGLDDDFVPQGLFIDEDGNRYVTGYLGDDESARQGVLYIQSPDGTVIARIPLDGIDHYGGVAVDGDHVYVSGGGQVQLYSLEDLMQADGGSTPPDPVDSVAVGASSTVTFHDGHVWVANFDADDGNQQILSYPVGDDGRIQQVPIPFAGNLALPDDQLSGPSKMQGIAVDDDYVYVAQSHERDSEDSLITRIDRHSGAEQTIHVPSNMLEGIALHDGRLVQVYESGAEKYQDGGKEPRDTYSHVHVD